MELTDSVKLEIINWLESNLTRTGITKAELARSTDVSKQAVTRWFSKGLISKENLIKVSQVFNSEPPLDLVSLKPTYNKNPLAYNWTPSARTLVALLMEDQETAQGRAKIEALLKIYDVVNNSIK